MSAIKFAEGGTLEGIAVPFGGPARRDRHGEYFDAESDLALDWYPDRPVLLHHGVSQAGPTVVGRVTAIEKRPEGWWVRCQLDKAGKWFGEIVDMLGKGLLSFSSGTMAHLMRVAPGGRIESFPLCELSLTPSPASDDARIFSVKAADLAAHLAAIRGYTAADRDELRLIRAHLDGIEPIRGYAAPGMADAHLIQRDPATVMADGRS